MRKFKLSSLFGLFVVFSVLSQVTVQKEDGGLLFTENDKNILFYQIAPKNQDGKYERCNYIHPLWGIEGTVLTEDFPVDHPHQRGIFWAWHQIFVKDKSIGDGWGLKNFEQRVASTKIESLNDGSAVLKTEVYWISNMWKPEGKENSYMKENTTITIHKKNENYRKIDFEISLLALVKDLEIGGSDDEKGYGGFSLRIALPEDVKFKGIKGDVTPLNTAVKSEGFINVSGSFERNNGKGGIVIIDDRQNSKYPQAWILRKEKSMQNIVFPGKSKVAVSMLEPIILKYSILIYSQNLSKEKIQKIINKHKTYSTK